MGDDLACRAKLLADQLRLPDKGFEDDVLLTLLEKEVAAPDGRRGLQLSVDPAIALFEPRRVPRQVDMDEVVAAGLKVDALTRRVGADENTQRVGRGISVEATLQLLPAIDRRGPGKGSNAVVGSQVVEGLGEALLQPAADVLVFGEEDRAVDCSSVQLAQGSALTHSVSQRARASGRWAFAFAKASIASTLAMSEIGAAKTAVASAA